jgi:hypothetical protein
MKEIDDEYPFPFRKSSGKTREEHHAAQMRKLLSQIPCYAIQARRRLETEGQKGEMHYWLALYQEFNQRPIRSITVSQAPHGSLWPLHRPANLDSSVDENRPGAMKLNHLSSVYDREISHRTFH